MSEDRPVHASFKTRGLPRHWEATFDGRWFHVGHGDSFANTIEAVTCGRCRTYIEDDAVAADGVASCTG